MLTLFVVGIMTWTQPQPVAVELDIRDHQHPYIYVEIHFNPSAQYQRTLTMPNWIPGSYKIRDFARHVESFEAHTSEGDTLNHERLRKDSWIVDVVKNQPFSVSYAVFTDEASVRTSLLTHDYALLNPASLLVYDSTSRSKPHQVTVSVPSTWRVAAALPETDRHVFMANSFDQLVDSPMVAGNLQILDFEVQGIPHRWAIAGLAAGDVLAMVPDMQRICSEIYMTFQKAPFDRFVFLSFFAHGARGGLEHSSSTLLGVDTDALLTSEGWNRFLGLIAHEYFHAWNVKAIRDQALTPYQYQTEVYSDLLWFHEGITSYYDQLVPLRAGLISEKASLDTWAKDLTTYFETPGRQVQSLEDASRNAWIHQYQPSSARPNAQVSYYSAGALSGFALDATIRRKSKDKYSLDDLMRHLFNLNRSVSSTDITSWLSDNCGAEAAQFLDQHIKQANELPLMQAIQDLGLRFAEKQEDDHPQQNGFKAPTEFEIEGLIVNETPDACTVTSVLRDTAAWKAGFTAGDVILAFDHIQVVPRKMATVLTARGQNTPTEVCLSRAGQLMTLTADVTPKAKPLSLQKNDSASELQKKRLQSWLTSAVKNKESTNATD
ncbi:MAG: M61 family metallopeptidase [Acidobacteria bacterium]|nr:M61 family metallopeptidase [Acidobacteriota bacterium]